MTLEYGDIITGEKFAQMCPEIFSHYDARRWRCDPSSTLFYTDIYKYEDMLPHLPTDRPIKIVTHNADKSFTDEMAEKLPQNVTACFSQNVVTSHPKVHPIPIGLENERWFTDQHRKQRILDARNGNALPTRLVYLNFSIDTNPGVRKEVWDHFSGQSWCTAEPWNRDRAIRGENFDNYLAGVNDHFYVISPQGNGVDCHRTWEALYMRRVPVMLKGHNSLYSDMRVLLVDNWESVTEELLVSKKEHFLTGKFNDAKLKFSYWSELICQC